MKTKMWKLSTDNDGSQRLSVREFQVTGPATEKAWRVYSEVLGKTNHDSYQITAPYHSK